jgi:5-formyltetrahydrofolate cyclo-ligase
VKKSLRDDIRRKLAEMEPAVAHAKSMAACKRLLAQPEFQKAQVVMIYLPMATEVDLAPVALRGWQEDKTIVAPRLSWDNRRMTPTIIRSLDTDIVTGHKGVPEPAEGEPVLVETIDLVIVPALAYDRHGNRLGRGAGFYDRFLAGAQFKGTSVGLAFREQVLDLLPIAPNDVAVHMLITDEEVIRFNRPGSGIAPAGEAPTGGQAKPGAG